MRPLLAVLVVALLAPACGTPAKRPASSQQQMNTQIDLPGGVYTLELRRTLDAWETSVPAPVERVWAAVPAVYEEIGLAGGGLLRDGERSFAYRARMPRRLAAKRPSTYVSCGRGMTGNNADEYEVRLFVVTSGAPTETGSTIGTTVDASATPRGVSGAAVPCTSTGELERLIARALLTAAGG